MLIIAHHYNTVRRICFIILEDHPTPLYFVYWLFYITDRCNNDWCSDIDLSNGEHFHTYRFKSFFCVQRGYSRSCRSPHLLKRHMLR